MSNVQVFDGIEFTEQENGYFRHSTLGLLMHRYVWEYYHGKIPSGHDIHHIDFNKSNNDITNLQCLPRAEHKKLHADLLTEEQREWRRNNLNVNARPKAIEWHKSEDGHNWHVEHGKRTAQNVRIFNNKCTVCGKEFNSKQKPSKFCCGACKQKFRRLTGVDDVERICCVCGATFRTNKYKRTTTCSKSCSAKLGHENDSKGN